MRDIWLCAACSDAATWPDRAKTQHLAAVKQLEQYGSVTLHGAWKLSIDHACDCCEGRTTQGRTLYYFQPVVAIRGVA